MPYIPQANRNRAEFDPSNAGELNYAITKLINDYLLIICAGDPHYGDYNEVIGVLECAKLELYRRLVAPYEEVKMLSNGDVYE